MSRFPGYTRGDDGLWRRRVEFDGGKVETLVRNGAGKLVRVERRGRGRPALFLHSPAQ